MDTKPSGLFKSHPTKPISKLMPTLMAIKKKSRTLKSSLASKVLLCKHKNLCMSPRTHVKKLDVVVHTDKASTGEVGASEPLRSLANEPRCLGSFRTMRDLVSKTNLVSVRRMSQTTLELVLWPPCAQHR